METAMVLVKCPNCGDTKVEKAVRQPNGTQRYRCCNALCSRTIFQLEYKYNAYNPKIKMKIIEMDEMWSFVQKKKEQYRLWHAIDHNTDAILAYVSGRRKHVVLKKLFKLLKPYKVRKVYANGNYAHGKYIGHDNVNVGKHGTQKIERIHLSLRTWIKCLARKTICFSKTRKMHESVVGLCINVKFFGRNLI